MLSGLWARRELLWQFTHRNVELRHRGSRLGAFWALLNPLSMLGLYFVLFGVLFGSQFGFPGETKYDYSLALFLGLSLFHLFTETLGWAPTVITSNPNFVKKVVFPLEVLPVAQVGAAVFHMAVSIGLVVVLSIFGRPGLSWPVLWLPVLVLPLVMISTGVALGLAALGVFVRDIGQLTAFLSTTLLFASAVMYAPARLEQHHLHVLAYNPLLQIVDLARRVVLWHEPISLAKLGFVYACAVVVLAAGTIFFSLLRKSFAEVI